MATRVPELAMFSVLLTAILSCVSFASRSATFVSIIGVPTSFFKSTGGTVIPSEVPLC